MCTSYRIKKTVFVSFNNTRHIFDVPSVAVHRVMFFENPTMNGETIHKANMWEKMGSGKAITHQTYVN